LALVCKIHGDGYGVGAEEKTITIKNKKLFKNQLKTSRRKLATCAICGITLVAG
jgi:hypothetical protein